MTGSSPSLLNALLANAFRMYASSLPMFSSVGGYGMDVGRAGIMRLTSAAGVGGTSFGCDGVTDMDPIAGGCFAVRLDYYQC